jgi:hypothetical protein
MLKENIIKLKDRVEYVLAKYPESRNCDKYLLCALIVSFYCHKTFDYRGDRGSSGTNTHSENYRPFKAVFLKDLLDLPSQELVARCRRKIQEEGKYLPTKPEIVKKRKINQEVWKAYILAN